MPASAFSAAVKVRRSSAAMERSTAAIFSRPPSIPNSERQ
jgi:hypothetical protein